MPEIVSNVELAQMIGENGLHSSHSHRAEWIEILEAVALAIVAVATAWSGFQAAKWDGQSTKQYTLASRVTVLAQEKATLAGQDRLYDIITFNSWTQAKTLGRQKLANFYERRFRPEYASAFAAWQGLDPFNNPSAAPGPIFLREYVNSNLRDSAKLSEEAILAFEKGVSMRETGDDYVRVTVFLATVLLLTAIGQRFKSLGPRFAIVTVAFVLLSASAYYLWTLARL